MVVRLVIVFKVISCVFEFRKLIMFECGKLEVVVSYYLQPQPPS